MALLFLTRVSPFLKVLAWNNFHSIASYMMDVNDRVDHIPVGARLLIEERKTKRPKDFLSTMWRGVCRSGMNTSEDEQRAKESPRSSCRDRLFFSKDHLASS